MEELKTIEKKIKGYGFDSLVFRYKLTREAQMRAEIRNICDGDGFKAQRAANRGLRRSMLILDDWMGEHN